MSLLTAQMLCYCRDKQKHEHQAGTGPDGRVRVG